MSEEQTKYMPTVINFEDYAITADVLRRRVDLIRTVMKEVMRDGEHYGVIPGCGNKPSLLKPGAEKLSTTFRLAPAYDIRRQDLPGGHREYEIVCTLTHMVSGQIVGQGVGAGTTMESKYRYRKAEQKCPKCGKESIIKGKKDYGGGWLCFSKKGGCGAKFKDGDQSIENQNMGRVEHDNPADYYNTVLKMAKKRAHVDAVLTATAASDIFTQDVEDMDNIIEVKQETTQQHDEQPQPEPDVDYITEAQRKRLFAIYKQAGKTDKEVQSYLNYNYGIVTSKEIPKQAYDDICKWAAEQPQREPGDEQE